MSENTIAATTDADAEVFEPITPYFAARVATQVLGYKVTESSMYGIAKRDGILTVDGHGPAKADGTYKTYFDGLAFKAWLDQRASNPGTSGKVDIDALTAKYSA
jgi:hypothetical protein